MILSEITRVMSFIYIVVLDEYISWIYLKINGARSLFPLNPKRTA